MSTEIEEVPIRDESIRLGQLLKLSGAVENGAVARELIEAGVVLVDGEVETRRGRQVSRGQIVELRGEEFGLPALRLTPADDEAEV